MSITIADPLVEGMNKPILVVVTTSFPIAGDGSEAAGSFVVDLVNELTEHARVRVVAPGASDVREQWSNRVEVFRYAAPPRPLSTLKPWRPRDFKWIFRVLHGGLSATRQASDGAGHIFALWGLPCGDWARKSARERGIKYSVWMLGSDVWSLGRMPILRGILARVIRQARCAYADGYMLADDAQRIAEVSVQFLPSTRHITLNNPPPPSDKPPYRLLFLGRWHPNKGVDLLLDALAFLEDSDWELIKKIEIQGGGFMESLVRKRTTALQNAGRPVEIGKYLTKAEAEDAIVRSDWVLIPSRIESIPVVFSDAMKLGRPVISTPVGDLPRLVTPGCGVVSSSVSPGGLLMAIRCALRASHGYDMRKIKARAEEFSCKVIAERVIKECFSEGRHV